MKRARILLLVLWFFINGCAVLAAPRPTLQPTAFALLPSNTPLSVSSPILSSTATQAPTSSFTAALTDTPAPSASLTPSPTPASSGIALENLSSLAQLHEFLPFNINTSATFYRIPALGEISPRSWLQCCLPPTWLWLSARMARPWRWAAVPS
jgi:hypothetical protein